MKRTKKSEPRNQQLNLSFTLQEITAIKRRAYALGLRPAHFGRSAVIEKVGGATETQQGQDPLARIIINQLSRLGNNLNQMVRHLHTTGEPLPSDLEPLLNDIRALMRRVAE